MRKKFGEQSTFSLNSEFLIVVLFFLFKISNFEYLFYLISFDKTNQIVFVTEEIKTNKSILLQRSSETIMIF